MFYKIRAVEIPLFDFIYICIKNNMLQMQHIYDLIIYKRRKIWKIPHRKQIGSLK